METKWLEKIVSEGSCSLTEEEKNSLVAFMLKHIGDENSYLRDELIYRGWSVLILNGYLSNAKLNSILQELISNKYLFFNLDLKDAKDAVFKRSFSALVICLILYKDTTERFLDYKLVKLAIERSIRYFELESDFRGYVELKGWAHAVAHGSDLIDTIVLHPLYSYDSNILEILRKKIIVSYPYIDDEQERMIQILESLLKHDLGEQELITWLETLVSFETSEGYENYRIQWNINKFLKELYFIAWKKEYRAIADWIIKRLT